MTIYTDFYTNQKQTYFFTMQEHFILADPTKRQFVKKLNQSQDKYT